MAGIRGRIATPVPEHVRMDRKRHPGALAKAGDQWTGMVSICARSKINARVNQIVC